MSVSFGRGSISSLPLKLGDPLGGFAQVGMVNVTGGSVVSLSSEALELPLTLCTPLMYPGTSDLGFWLMKDSLTHSYPVSHQPNP